MTTIAGKKIVFKEPEFQEFAYLIVNPDGLEVSYPLTERDVAAFSDDSYICAAAEVYQDVHIGDEVMQIAWFSGATSEYKGRDTGKETDLSVFSSSKSGKYTYLNDYFLVDKDLEPFFYSDGNRRSALLNEILKAKHVHDCEFNDEEANAFYMLLHKNSPTHSSLDVIVDKNRIVFGVITNDNSEDESIKVEVDKRWGELAVGDNFNDVRDDTRDVPKVTA